MSKFLAPIHGWLFNKIKVTIGENDLIEKGKEYVIFANTQKISENKKMYCTLNIYQGQFEVTNSKAINKSLKYTKSIENLEQEILNSK